MKETREFASIKPCSGLHYENILKAYLHVFLLHPLLGYEYAKRNKGRHLREALLRQKGESIEGQLRECKAYAQAHGFTVISEYVDRAMVRLKQGDRDLFSIFAKVL